MTTIADIAAVTGLGPLHLRAALRALGYHSVPPDTHIPLHRDRLGLAVYWLLHRLPFIDAAQRQTIFDELVPGLNGWTTLSSDTAVMLVVADGQFVTWSGRENWLDLQTGNVTEPPPILEVISYNIREQLRRLDLLCELRGTHEQSPAASRRPS